MAAAAGGAVRAAGRGARLRWLAVGTGIGLIVAVLTTWKNGFVRALWRLSAVQGAWNYERMTGVGMGHAAEPLLEDLKSVDPGRHAEASVRAAEYSTPIPYLAGVALGALVRARSTIWCRVPRLPGFGPR